MKSHIVFSSLFSLFFSLITATSSSVAASEHSTVTFALDNDSTFGVDQDYSNGIFISYTSSAISTPSMLTYLSLSIWEKPSLDKFEFTLGHKMWTPSDIESTEPVANDRPYAGYFYGEFNFISLSPQQVQRFNLTLGATGESSFADQAQKIVHKMTGSDEPKGWEYQIEDDVVGGIGYLSHVNLSRHALFDNDDSAHTSFNNTEFEISNITEINVGRFRSDVATGMMIRWGTDLAANMSAAGISTEHPFRPGMIGASSSAWFVFTGIEGRYRFNDITIEGKRPNIPDPENYPSTLENWQSSAVLGATWYNRHVGLSLTFTAKTPDYEQAQTALYGTSALALFAFF
ncbi:MAG: lipid A 3-O-deacylase [Moritella dasanensis]|jgi:lipid A 3-O-deacylase